MEQAAMAIISSRCGKRNLLEQIELIALLRRFFPIVAFDTEFSGFLRFTARRASDEARYSDLKYNVDNLRIIQLGISLFDVSGNQPMPRVAWQINFSDFDPDVDSCSPESIRLLKNSGINLQRNRREGVSSVRCAALLWEKLFDHHHSGSFVTFHGSYDVGYLMKMLTSGKPLVTSSIRIQLFVRFEHQNDQTKIYLNGRYSNLLPNILEILGICFIIGSSKTLFITVVLGRLIRPWVSNRK